jgi:uncharacterized protein (DUF736 family)
MRVHFKLTVYANSLGEAREEVYKEASKFLSVSVEDVKIMLDMELSVNNSFEETDLSGEKQFQIIAQANLKNSVVRPTTSSTYNGAITYGL